MGHWIFQMAPPLPGDHHPADSWDPPSCWSSWPAPVPWSESTMCRWRGCGSCRVPFWRYLEHLGTTLPTKTSWQRYEKRLVLVQSCIKNPRKVWSCNRPFQRLATACGCRSNPPESRGQSRAPWHPSSVARTRLWTPNSQRHAPNMCVMCFTALRPPNASWSGVRPPKFANITFLGCPRAWVIHLWSACQGGLIHNGTAVDDEAIAWH